MINKKLVFVDSMQLMNPSLEKTSQEFIRQ